MYVFYRALLCITYFGILIYCLSETSNSDDSSHYDSSGTLCSNVHCRQYTAVIAGSIVGGIIGIIVLITCILFYCYRCKRRPSQTNLTFINATNHKNNKHELYDNTLFKSGIWSSRYLHFGMWHGPDCFSLSFDSQSFTITGSGLDNIGLFIIDGIYSIKTGRIGLRKIYRLGATNHSGNTRHQVIIQLIWNSETRQFEGKRYVQTKKYREENRFELKFSKQQQQLVPSERV